jgi:hypothetical protein
MLPDGKKIMNSRRIKTGQYPIPERSYVTVAQFVNGLALSWKKLTKANT